MIRRVTCVLATKHNDRFHYFDHILSREASPCQRETLLPRSHPGFQYAAALEPWSSTKPRLAPRKFFVSVEKMVQVLWRDSPSTAPSSGSATSLPSTATSVQNRLGAALCESF